MFLLFLRQTMNSYLETLLYGEIELTNMPGSEVRDVLDQRLEMIRTMAPSMLIRYDIIESEFGEFGFIILTDQDSGLVGIDFIETDMSWRRENAVDQYNEAVIEGHLVTVIAPDDVLPSIRALISRSGNLSIVLTSYGEVGITIRT